MSNQETSQPFRISLGKRRRTGQTFPMESTTVSHSETDISGFTVPQPILRLITKTARRFAAMECSMRNLNERATKLAEDKTNGIVPKHISFKVNKLFTSEEHSIVRTTFINIAIENDIQRLNDKYAILSNEYSNRVTLLMNELNPILTECKMTADVMELANQLDFEIQSFKVNFLLKQNQDAKRKEEKLQKFMEAKERNETEAKLSTKEVQSMKATIKKLQKTVQNLSLKPKKPNPTKQGKGQGSRSKKPKRNPKPKRKSTGTGKRSAGKRKSTAKGKKSTGRNGRQ